jgi:hypothetical protein
MGREMSSLKLVLALACALSLFGCGTRAADTGRALSAGATDREIQADLAAPAPGGPLEECQLPQITVVPTTLPAGSIDRARAERRVAIGTKGAAAIALPVLVTIGIKVGQLPTPDALLVDSHSQPIVSRPAWALVYRNQSVPRPNGPARPKGSTQAHRELPSLSVVAAVIDARTGDFLMGWGCDAPVQ